MMMADDKIEKPIAERLEHVAIGYRYTLVVISHAKRMLTFDDCPADFRLKVLQYFDKWIDTYLTAEMIAQVEPMCAEGESLVNEARKLGYKEAFDVFASWEVFNAFVALNPSLLRAIKMSPAYQYHPKREAATDQATA